MPLLRQRIAQLALHGGQFRFGDADLIGSAAWQDDARLVLRVLGKPHHGLRQSPHRPHEQPLQADIDRDGGEDRDECAQHQDVASEVEHGGAQRPVADDELEILAVMGRANQAQRPWGAGEQRGEGVADRASVSVTLRSAVSSTVGGISTVASSRVAGPVRTTIAVAPTAESRSS